MFHRPPCVEHQRESLARLLRVWLPLDREELGSAVRRGELAVPIEPAGWRRTAVGALGVVLCEWPLDRVMLVEQFVAQARVIAQSALRNAASLIKRVLRIGPTGV